MEITSDIGTAAAYIKEGRVVAFPTGTSYGLAVDALQGHALQRLRNLKGRPRDKTFTIFMRDSLWAQFLTLTAAEEKLLHHFAGSPLTLLVVPQESLRHLAQDGRIGVRSLDHPVMQQLAEAVNVPLTATSANRATEEPCFSPTAVAETFPGKIDATTYDLSLAAILDGGLLPSASPTTIAQIASDGSMSILRAGAVVAAQLQAALQA